MYEYESKNKRVIREQACFIKVGAKAKGQGGDREEGRKP